VDEFGTAKTNSIEDVIQDIKIENETQEQIREREAPIFQQQAKDKQYYINLQKYNTIKSM